MSRTLNNEVSILMARGSANDITDVFTRDMICETTEPNATASKDYTKGETFIWSDRKLYKAKTNILAGTTLSSASNGNIKPVSPLASGGDAYATEDPVSDTINNTDYIPLCGSDGTKKKSLITILAAKVKSLIPSATEETSGLLSADDKTALDNRSGLITIPTISYDSLPSKSTENETYLKEWLAYICQNYASRIDNYKYITAIVRPNGYGNVTGHIYSAEEVHSTTKLPRYSSFIYTPLGNLVQIRFGTNNYVWYFQAFRNPTGNASAAQVVSGYTFSNASGDGITGTFAAQTKSVTSSRSAQTVTPDSGKYLSSVSIGKYPDANGTYTPTGSNLNSSAADMGTTNNLRYVNTSVCYIAGRNSTKSKYFDITSAGGEVAVDIPLPFSSSQVKITDVIYTNGSYASGDTIYLVESSTSISSKVALNAAKGQTLTKSNARFVGVNLKGTGSGRSVTIVFEIVV